MDLQKRADYEVNYTVDPSIIFQNGAISWF